MDCSQHDYCTGCKLFHKNGGRCEGCTKKHRAALRPEFRWCYQECHSCTGYKATVTAICCRSPLKNMYLDAVTQNPDNWNEPQYTFTKRPLLAFKRKAIFHIGQKCNAKAVIGDAVIDHEIVATNLKVVMKPSGKGFVSTDLHDFLSLNKRTKILLTTMDIDDLLEAAFKEEFYADPATYEKAGVSYWMPLAFSTYAGDAKMHRYYQFCRTMFCTDRSKPHFLPGYYLSPGMKTDDIITEALKSIPQVMFNAQFLGSKKSDNTIQTFRLIKRWHEFAPKHVAFWIVGASTPTFFHNVRRIVGDRDVYYVSAKAQYMTMWGQRMKEDGNERDLLPDEHPEKPTLVRENFKTFARLVKTWNKPKDEADVEA